MVQYDELKYVNVDNKIEVLATWEFQSCNFETIVLKWIISVIYGAQDLQDYQFIKLRK